MRGRTGSVRMRTWIFEFRHLLWAGRIENVGMGKRFFNESDGSWAVRDRGAIGKPKAAPMTRRGL